MSEDDEQYDESELADAEPSETSRGKAELDSELEDMDVDAPGSAADASDGPTEEAEVGATDAVSDTEPVAETKFCTDCGAEINRDAEICPECGVRQESTSGSSSSGEKESGISAVLSFLLPGVGQLYNGQVSRGAIVFVGWMIWEFVAFIVTTLTLGIFFLIWVPVELFVHVVAAYDAYDQAEKINAGDVVVD